MHYVWMVPFNLNELIEKMGGPDITAERLDVFFMKLNGGISQYAWLGRGSVWKTPWIYDFVGQPLKAQQIVRRAMTEIWYPSAKRQLYMTK